MSEKIEQKVLNFINLHNLLPNGAKILLAVSGGADSVTLLKILVGLKLSGKINNDFRIAHINHLLRGEKSFEDEAFVKALSEKYELPVTIERVDVKKYAQENKLSIETAGRKLRLEKLAMTAQKNGCDCVAAAHQKNDNAETIIHRLIRGTGFKGLAGIRPKTVLNGMTFIRPLLCAGREEIENYLVSEDIKWRTDHTNLDCRFTRNRIRHKILPLLQSQGCSNPAELLSILSQHCLAFSQSIEKQAKEAWQRCVLNQMEHSVSVDISKFNDYPSLLKAEILQNAFRYCGIGLQKITTEHYDRIIKFLTTGLPNKILQLPNKAVIKKQRESFCLGYPETCAEQSGPVQLKIPGSVCFSDWIIETETLPADKEAIKTIKNKKNSFTEWFDLEQIKPPLIARFRQKGDRFRPFGFETSKKIGKFITSAKLNSEQRKKVFLICDSKKILWLVPIRRSDEAAIMDKSELLLQINIRNNPQQDI
jgi:tRNA(Ile)-lysidine synthase